MVGSRSIPRKPLIALLALALVLPAAAFLPTGTDAQSPVVECEDQRLRFPLWISEVQILDESESELGRMGFVESGEELDFVVTFRNRVDPTCDQPVYARERTDDLAMEVTYLPDPDDEGADRVESYLETNMRCTSGPGGDEELRPGQTCEMRFSLPGREVKQHTSGIDHGEQRIRFMLGDEGPCPYTGETGDAGQSFEECKLAGAERVLVVDALPDLRPTEIEWLTPEDPTERHTRYGTDVSSTFDVLVENRGEYPTWAPNAPHDEGLYFERSSFDTPGDGNERPDDEPECTGDQCDEVSGDQVNLPPCLFDSGASEDRPRCSYRRGAVLDMPIFYQVNRENEHRIIEEGVIGTDLASSSDDKHNAILHEGNEEGDDNEQALDLSAFNLRRKAGSYNLTVFVDQDADGSSVVPEANEDDNDRMTQLDVLGVDLQLESPGIVVEGQGSGLGCTTPDNPCPAGAMIRVDPTFTNDGDPESAYDDDPEVHEVDWSSAVWIKQGTNEWKIAQTENQDGELEPAVRNHSGIPDRGQNERVWPNQVPRIATDPNGGLHWIAIRLDHPGNYLRDTPVSNPEGLVGELVDSFETEDCTLPISEVDNAYCLPLYFEDTTIPDIASISTDPAAEEGQVLRVQEGTNLTLRATVHDNSIQSVQAHLNFTGNDTNERVLEMEPVDGETDVFEVNTTFTELKELVYRVRASDGQHVNWSATGIEMEIVGLPKTIEVTRFEVNGDTSFQNEENAPEYRGTVSNPGNEFSIVARINGTGLDEPTTEGKNVTVYAPNGTATRTVGMGSETYCTLNGGPTGSGDQCNTNALGRNDEGQEVSNVHTRFYVDTREERWGDVELPFVGFFNVSVEVTDVNGRMNTTNETARILDPDGPPTLENAAYSPTEVNPGQTVEASTEAYDGLRVERVFLRVTKPDDSVAEHNLSIDEVFDEERRNGTYTGSFGSGVGETFDQAGTYQVEMVATDFGGAESEPVELPELRVNDTDTPTIDEFSTLPAGEQEIGGNITWVLQVTDSTAVQPPVLRVERPTSGPTGPIEMQPTGELGRYNYTLHASAADVGTWTYDVEVSDFTGKVATAEGQIEVKENLPPQAQKWKPNVLGPEGNVYGPAQPTIEAEIVDFGSGVNESTITMTVDGDEVDVPGDASLTPIPDVCEGCWRIQYTPEQAFEDGDPVTVTLTAEDHSEPEPLEATKLRHSFTVDASGPSASIEAAPSVVKDSERVIGLITDINVSVSDGASGPAGATVKAVELAGTTAVPPEQSARIERAQDTIQLQELWETFPGHGRYRLEIIPEDNVGNTGQAVQQTYLFDQAPPKIEPVPTVGKPPEFIDVRITDDSRVESAVVKFKANDGPTNEIQLELEDDTWKGEIINPETDQPYPKNTTIEHWIEARDMFGNTASQEPQTFEAGDTVPTIRITRPEDGATISGQTRIAWTATDAETDDPRDLQISLYYKKPGAEGFTPIPDAKGLENLGQYTLDTSLLPNGEVILEAIVYDGVSFGDDKVNVTVRNLGDFFQAPEIPAAERIDNRNVVAPGQEIVFAVNVNGQASSVWANITRDGDVVQSVPLDDQGDGTWSKAFEAPSEAGAYEIDLAAVTDDGPQQTRGAYTFSVDGGVQDSKSFVPEWTILSILFAAAVGVGAVGLAQRWN